MSIYGVILLSICVLDLVYTAVGLKVGWFKGELNPFLAWFLIHWGIIGLASVKCFINVVAIFILEFISRANKIPERKMANYYKFVIYAYLFIFGGGVLLQFLLR